MSVKAVILIGGPQKGTRFRPLSMDLPKPLFPIAGVPMIYHHIDACAKIPGLKEILLVGCFNDADINPFVASCQREFKVIIRYLREYTSLGTGGGLYHFRDHILFGEPECFFVLHGDICSSFPLQNMMDFYLSHSCKHVLMGKRLENIPPFTYGQIVENAETGEVLHYAEKPESLVSHVINCGIYLFRPSIFDEIAKVFLNKYQQFDELESSIPSTESRDVISLEKDVIAPLSSSGLFVLYKTTDFWRQIKTAGSALYANAIYLAESKTTSADANPTRSTRRISHFLEGNNSINANHVIGNVIVHNTASIDPTSKLGPNVSIGPGVRIESGVRVMNSIILDGVVVKKHACVMHSIIGWKSVVGEWARVEGTSFQEPGIGNKFVDGKKNPGVTILGEDVQIGDELNIRNCVVLPHKSISESCQNSILL